MSHIRHSGESSHNFCHPDASRGSIVTLSRLDPRLRGDTKFRNGSRTWSFRRKPESARRQRDSGFRRNDDEECLGLMAKADKVSKALKELSKHQKSLAPFDMRKAFAGGVTGSLNFRQRRMTCCWIFPNAR